MRALALTILLSGCTPDKYLHAVAGVGIGIAGEELTGQGCAIALAAGVAKELIDPVFSTLDVIATGAICVPLLLAP